MSAKPTTTKELLAKELAPEQIKQFIDERKAMGATSCEVVTETNRVQIPIFITCFHAVTQRPHKALRVPV